jgi:hypothetical protein
MRPRMRDRRKGVRLRMFAALILFAFAGRGFGQDPPRPRERDVRERRERERKADQNGSLARDGDRLAKGDETLNRKGDSAGAKGEGLSRESSRLNADSDKTDTRRVQEEAAANRRGGLPEDAVKLRGDQGYRDQDGNIWKKDQLHKDHWNVSDRKGNKVKEIDFNGRQIWPDGPKNKNK